MMRRGSRRRSGTQAVGSLMGAQLDAMQIARKIREHTAPIVWADVVGAQVAGATEVLGVDGGVLRISTKSGVWAHELTFYKADILRRLNARLGASGEPIIRDLMFQNRGISPTLPEPPPVDPTPDELDAVELSSTELDLIECSIAEVRDDAFRAKIRRTRVTELRLRTWRLDHEWMPCPRCGELLSPRANGCPRCRMFGPG